MMEVTATMLPSTIMNDRSLFAQMDDSAIPIESRTWFMVLLFYSDPRRFYS